MTVAGSAFRGACGACGAGPSRACRGGGDGGGAGDGGHHRQLPRSRRPASSPARAEWPGRQPVAGQPGAAPAPGGCRSQRTTWQDGQSDRNPFRLQRTAHAPSAGQTAPIRWSDSGRFTGMIVDRLMFWFSHRESGRNWSEVGGSPQRRHGSASIQPILGQGSGEHRSAWTPSDPPLVMLPPLRTSVMSRVAN